MQTQGHTNTHNQTRTQTNTNTNTYAREETHTLTSIFVCCYFSNLSYNYQWIRLPILLNLLNHAMEFKFFSVYIIELHIEIFKIENTFFIHFSCIIKYHVIIICDIFCVDGLDIYCSGYLLTYKSMSQSKHRLCTYIYKCLFLYLLYIHLSLFLPLSLSPYIHLSSMLPIYIPL